MGALAGCGTGRTSATSGASDAGAGERWEFSDGRGRKASAPDRPERIVAYAGAAAALWDFGLRPIGVFGPTERSDGSKDYQAGNLDPSTVTSVGDVWGEFDVEKLASLRPDLVVSLLMGGQRTPWYVPEESVEEVEKLAPIAAVQVSGSEGVELLDAIQDFERLAESLGADPDQAGVPAAKRRLKRVTDRLTDRAGAGPRRPKLVAVSGTADALYVAAPEDHLDLAYLVEHGVDVIAPDQADAGGYWQKLSWENADKYEADVVLWDARAGNFTPNQYRKQPVWSGLPMAKPERMLPWRVEAPLSYQQYAAVLEELVNGLETARASMS